MCTLKADGAHRAAFGTPERLSWKFDPERVLVRLRKTALVLGLARCLFHYLVGKEHLQLNRCTFGRFAKLSSTVRSRLNDGSSILLLDRPSYYCVRHWLESLSDILQYMDDAVRRVTPCKSSIDVVWRFHFGTGLSGTSNTGEEYPVA